MSNLIEIADGMLPRNVDPSLRPMLVYFYASWSVECRIPEKTLEILASELADELDFCRANLDKHPELARRYHITKVPSLVLFHHGIPVADLGGMTPSAELKAHLEGLLADYAASSEKGNSR